MSASPIFAARLVPFAAPSVVSGQPFAAPRTRALHLVDLENLLGGTAACAGDIENAWSVFSFGVGIGQTDHVVVATSHRLARVAWFALPPGRVQLRVRSGPNGADLALLAELDVRHAAARFDWLVIASGDGIFTAAALAARANGLKVHQVTGRGQSHRDLHAACTRHTQLKLWPVEAPAGNPIPLPTAAGVVEHSPKTHRTEEGRDVRARRRGRTAVEAGAVSRGWVQIQARPHRSRCQGGSDGRR